MTFNPIIPNNFPAGWVIDSSKPVVLTDPYTFWLYLNHPETQLLANFLAVSDPSNAKYGSYKSYNELQTYNIDSQLVGNIIKQLQLDFGPSATITTLWTGDVIAVTTTVGAVQTYFKVPLAWWYIPQSFDPYAAPIEILRTQSSITIPSTLAPYIDSIEAITPITFFPYTTSAEIRAIYKTPQPETITAATLFHYYYGAFQPPTVQQTQGKHIKQAFYTDIQEGGPSLSDTANLLRDALGYSATQMQDFQEGKGVFQFTTPPASDPQWSAWNTSPLTEANIDLAMLLLTGQNITTIQLADEGDELLLDFSESGNSQGYPLAILDSYEPSDALSAKQLKVTNTLSGMFLQLYAIAATNPNATIDDLPDLPQVISISYGWVMNLLEPLLLIRINREMMKLGLMGITVVVSAGDTGSTIDNVCYGNGDLMMLPAVTSVGYSYLDTSTGTPQETLVNYSVGQTGASAFGLSELFARSTYMSFADTAVNQYLKQSDVQNTLAAISKYQPKQQFFPTTGRAYPDIVGLGYVMDIYCQSSPCSAQGASMAAPVIAGLFSTLNYWRKFNGQPYLGYVNPLLYANSAQMTPVVGNNQNTSMGSNDPVAYFSCIPGLPYSAAGLGGINFTKLFNALGLKQ